MARQRIDEEERRIRILTAERSVDGLISVINRPGIRATYASLAIDGLVSLATPSAWEGLCEFAPLAGSPAAELLVERLARERSPGAVKTLGEALRNPLPFVRSAALRYFASLPTSAGMAFLLRASRDPEPSIARMARATLLRRVEQRPAILGEMRLATAEGIFELLDDRWAMELLAEDYVDQVRLLAASRLGRIGGEDATTTLAAMIETTSGALQEACWKALETSAHVPDHLLLPLVLSSDPGTKARSLAIYARTVSAEGKGLLAGLAKDGEPNVRRVALRGLVRLLEKGAVPYLVESLKDAVVEVRLVAIELLASLPDTEIEILEAVERNQGDVRRKALIALANRGVVTPDLVMPYIEFILKGAGVTDLAQREYLDGIAAAAKALGQSQLPEAMLALTSLCRSVIRRMRRIGVEALMLFEPRDRADALHSLIDTYDPDVLKNIAFGLLEAEDPRAIVPLIRAASECKGRANTKAKELLAARPEIEDLEFLLHALAEKWATVRRWAAERLKFLRDRRAVAALLHASRDEDVEVQLAVFEALSPFASDEQPVTDRMLEAISFGDISVRQAACEALGEARCKVAVPELVKALHNTFLRPRATEALKRIGDRKGYLALKRLERREKLFKKRPGPARGAHKKKKVAAD